MMFATVESRDAQGGARTFFRDLFSLPEIELQRVSVPFGDAFYRVIATEYRGQIPVEETCEKLRRLKGGVIFDLHFPCDERTQDFEFEPCTFRQLLLFNSAVEYIHNLGLSALKSSLTVFDPYGVFARHIYKAVPLFSKIQVFTRETALYESTSGELMDNYGISLPVCDRFTGKAPATTAVICAEEVPFCDFYGGILFTNAERVPACSHCVHGEEIDLPGEYELLRPKGIDKMHFAAALFEKSGVKALGEMTFKKMRLT